MNKTQTRILRAGQALHATGVPEWHGRQAAQVAEAADGNHWRSLIGFGTLRGALEMLEALGYLTSRLEDAALADTEQRPQRRLYALTAKGLRAPEGDGALHADAGQPEAST